MATKQCPKCIHSEMCKFIEEIEEIKKEHPFVESINCNKFIHTKEFKQINTQTNTEEEPISEAASSEKPVRKKLSLKKTEPDTKSEQDTPSFDDLLLENYISGDIAAALYQKDIHNYKDLSAYQDKVKNEQASWAEIPGITPDVIKEINNMLSAFNKPNIGDSL